MCVSVGVSAFCWDDCKNMAEFRAASKPFGTVWLVADSSSLLLSIFFSISHTLFHRRYCLLLLSLLFWYLNISLSNRLLLDHFPMIDCISTINWSSSSSSSKRSNRRRRRRIGTRRLCLGRRLGKNVIHTRAKIWNEMKWRKQSRKVSKNEKRAERCSKTICCFKLLLLGCSSRLFVCVLFAYRRQTMNQCTLMKWWSGLVWGEWGH